MPEEPLSARPSWWKKLRSAASTGALVLFVVGLIVRLTIRDRFLVANTIYYATPWSVLFVLGCVSALRLRSWKAPAWLISAVMAAGCACAGMWGATAWMLWKLPSDPGEVRFLTWNMGHGRWGLEGLAAAAAKLEPDIAAFVEADPKTGDIRSIFKAAFPEHHVFMLGGGVVLVSRWPGGEARAYEFGSLKTESRIREVDLDTPWGTWTVFGCDIASNIFYQREPHFRELSSRIAKCTHPVIVAGDFNTPLDSMHLGQFRAAGLHEAFETAGSGYLPTWPVPAPVLSLDQVWVGHGLKADSCTRHWHWRSDHAAVMATIRTAP